MHILSLNIISKDLETHRLKLKLLLEEFSNFYGKDYTGLFIKDKSGFDLEYADSLDCSDCWIIYEKEGVYFYTSFVLYHYFSFQDYLVKFSNWYSFSFSLVDKNIIDYFYIFGRNAGVNPKSNDDHRKHYYGNQSSLIKYLVIKKGSFFWSKKNLKFIHMYLNSMSKNASFSKNASLLFSNKWSTVYKWLNESDEELSLEERKGKEILLLFFKRKSLFGR